MTLCSLHATLVTGRVVNVALFIEQVVAISPRNTKMRREGASGRFQYQGVTPVGCGQSDTKSLVH